MDDRGVPPPSTAAGPTDPLRSLLRAVHLLSADQITPVVAEHARGLGMHETVIYLIDYEQVTLVPLPGSAAPPRQALSVEGTVAGLAFRRVDVRRTPGSGGRQRRWVPLLDGVERLGVIEFVVDQPSVELEDKARTLASLVAELIIVNDAYSDFFSRLRRRRAMSLAAEIQWELLPPLSFATHRVVIAGALEPAYEIGGDTFDYADTADFLVLDSVGHGLPAALLSAAAVGAYRHARRELLDLPAIAQAVDAVIAEQFGSSQFATAAMLVWTSTPDDCAGSTPAIPPRSSSGGGSLVHPPHCPPTGRWGCRGQDPSPARPGSSRETGSCSTPTESLRPARRPVSSSVSSASVTSSPARRPPQRRSGA